MKTSKIRKVVVTGDNLFLYRYRFLFEKMSDMFDTLEYLPSSGSNRINLIKDLAKTLIGFFQIAIPARAGIFSKNAQAFIAKSQQTERQIRQLPYTPDLVIHVFSMCCPFWDKFDIPYAMYLDYTMALAKKNWFPWAPFKDRQAYYAWLECERLTYERASYIFTMSDLVKSSLIEDYKIKPSKITVVGAAANRQESYEQEKSFGSQQILFNGSDFNRKGGDLVLAAFKQVRKTLPTAKLVVIGKRLLLRENGVVNPGRISSTLEMRNLFLNADLVVAPGRCDPFPSFLIEAMNYGIPCIVSDRDGMPEIVDHGVNGIVLEQATPELLAQQICDLLVDIPRLTLMSRHAQHKVKTQLNWNCVAKRITQVLLP